MKVRALLGSTMALVGAMVAFGATGAAGTASAPPTTISTTTISTTTISTTTSTVPAGPLTVPGSLDAENPFVPDRDFRDCYSMLPKPNCGSEARGGWAQMTVFGAIVVGIGFIGWRIVRSARRARPVDPSARAS